MPKPRPRRRNASRPGTRPRTAEQPLVAQPAPGVRGQVERTSAGLLVWLSARPRWFVPVVSGALLVGGLFAPPRFGVPLLLLLTGFVGWLSYLSWPVVPRRARLVRVALLGLLLTAVADKLVGA